MGNNGPVRSIAALITFLYLGTASADATVPARGADGWLQDCAVRLRRALDEATRRDQWFSAGQIETNATTVKLADEQYDVSFGLTERADEGWHEPAVAYRFDAVILLARYHAGRYAWLSLSTVSEADLPAARRRLFVRVFRGAADGCLATSSKR